jgi:ribose transport system ATP-binding protein
VPTRVGSATFQAEPAGAAPRVAVRQANKFYPGVHALIDVDLDLAGGEIHGIVGQNGAGKSTFVRILSGVEQPDSGTIEVDGVPTRLKAPPDAHKAGIYTVHQEFSLFPYLSAAENLHIDQLPRRAGRLVDWRRARSQATEEIARLGFHFDVRKPVGSLPVAHQQAVEIAKAIRLNAKAILLDEPTATLSKTESERLFAVLRQLQASGVALLYISHRMDELFEICARLSVFRDGRRIDTFSVRDSSRNDVVRAMLGRRLLNESVSPDGQEAPRPRPLGTGTASGKIALQVENLSDGSVLHGIDLAVHRGEVLGVTGLAGNGQAELAACLFGARPRISGRFVIDGRERDVKTPAEAIRCGLGLLPEDRKSQGLVLGMSVTNNVTLASLPRFSRYSVLRRRSEVRTARQMQSALGIKVASVQQSAVELSGGNQQKVIFAKWLVNAADILILDEPTRGVDVGARAELYELVREFTRAGGSAVLITSDLEEALACDRVAVMRSGRIAGFVEAERLQSEGESAVLELTA